MIFIRPAIFMLVFCGFLPSAANAQATYPDRPVHIVVGNAPGAGNDFVARLLGDGLSKIWGQPVIVENRAGAGGNIAESYVAHSAPDGYTIMLANNNHTYIPTDHELPYDPVKDFAPITLPVFFRGLLTMNPAVPANNLKELIAYAKANPGKLNFGSGGLGGGPYLQMMLLEQRAGIQLTSIIYKGGGPMQTALLSGEIQLLFIGIDAGQVQLVKSGMIKALAVATDARSPLLPDVPTVAEAADLPGFNERSWQGLLAPAGTPKEVINKIHDDVVRVLHQPDVQQILVAQDLTALGNSPEEFAEFLKADFAKWATLERQPN